MGTVSVEGTQPPDLWWLLLQSLWCFSKQRLDDHTDLPKSPRNGGQPETINYLCAKGTGYRYQLQTQNLKRFVLTSSSTQYCVLFQSYSKIISLWYLYVFMPKGSCPHFSNICKTLMYSGTYNYNKFCKKPKMNGMLTILLHWRQQIHWSSVSTNIELRRSFTSSAAAKWQ